MIRRMGAASPRRPRSRRSPGRSAAAGPGKDAAAEGAVDDERGDVGAGELAVGEQPGGSMGSLVRRSWTTKAHRPPGRPPRLAGRRRAEHVSPAPISALWSSAQGHRASTAPTSRTGRGGRRPALRQVPTGHATISRANGTLIRKTSRQLTVSTRSPAEERAKGPAMPPSADHGPMAQAGPGHGTTTGSRQAARVSRAPPTPAARGRRPARCSGPARTAATRGRNHADDEDAAPPVTVGQRAAEQDQRGQGQRELFTVHCSPDRAGRTPGRSPAAPPGQRWRPGTPCRTPSPWRPRPAALRRAQRDRSSRCCWSRGRQPTMRCVR